MPSLRPFVFGKSPRYGDFISAGLTPAQETAWDGFGAAVMARARDHWGEAHADMHAQAAMWRFALPAGTLALDGWTIGALCPSMDSVGRLFLLAAGVTGAEDTTLAASETLADDAEEALWQTLINGWDKEALAATIAEKAADLPPGAGLRPRWWTAQGVENPVIVPDDLFTVLPSPMPDEANS